MDEYDEFGNLIQKGGNTDNDPYGYGGDGDQYDEFGNLIQGGGRGNATTDDPYNYGGGGGADEYDEFGNLITTNNDNDNLGGNGEEEVEYDEWGNPVQRRRGPSIWDEPMPESPKADKNKNGDGQEDGATDEEAAAKKKAEEEEAQRRAAEARQSKRITEVFKEPGIPVESDPHIPKDVHQLRKHSLFHEMLWNDFYRLCAANSKKQRKSKHASSISSGTFAAAPPIAGIITDVPNPLACLHRVKIQKDVHLMEQNQPEVENGCGQYVFFLTKGLAEVQKDGVAIATIEEGSSFGEESVLSMSATNLESGAAPPVSRHSIVTKSYCEAWCIGRELFQQLSWRKRLAARRPHRL